MVYDGKSRNIPLKWMIWGSPGYPYFRKPPYPTQTDEMKRTKWSASHFRQSRLCNSMSLGCRREVWDRNNQLFLSISIYSYHFLSILIYSYHFLSSPIPMFLTIHGYKWQHWLKKSEFHLPSPRVQQRRPTPAQGLRLALRRRRRAGAWRWTFSHQIGVVGQCDSHGKSMEKRWENHRTSIVWM